MKYFCVEIESIKDEFVFETKWIVTDCIVHALQEAARSYHDPFRFESPTTYVSKTIRLICSEVTRPQFDVGNNSHRYSQPLTTNSAWTYTTDTSTLPNGVQQTLREVEAPDGQRWVLNHNEQVNWVRNAETGRYSPVTEMQMREERLRQEQIEHATQNIRFMPIVNDNMS